MRWDLGTLQIDRLIVHEVPRPQVGGAPTLSEVAQPFSVEVRNYFRERINDSLAQAAIDAVEDPESGSPVPNASRTLLADPESFVDASQQIANHLYSSQTNVNNPGLLTVATGSIEGRACACVLKLEKEEGVRVRQDDVNGQLSFSLEHLHDLMLTRKTRVFKVGLLAVEDVDDSTALVAMVSDVQAQITPRHHVAAFFLTKFLGFRLAEGADILTERLYQAGQVFINEHVDDAADKGAYEVALIAELQSNNAQFNPTQFANQHMRQEHRQPFIDQLSAAQLPANLVPKDTARIANILKRIQVRFRGGVSIVAPPDIFSEQVQMTNLEDGRTRATIEDIVDDVKTRG